MAMPFAVVGSNTLIEVGGKKARGRLYPWGVVEGTTLLFSQHTILLHSLHFSSFLSCHHLFFIFHYLYCTPNTLVSMVWKCLYLIFILITAILTDSLSMCNWIPCQQFNFGNTQLINGAIFLLNIFVLYCVFCLSSHLLISFLSYWSYSDIHLCFVCLLVENPDHCDFSKLRTMLM